MSANVETMFYTGREVPWHGLGVQVENAPTSDEAIKVAGLDWTVSKRPVQVGRKNVPGYFANVRDTDESILGIVGDRYQIIQNKDAFAFTDALVGTGDVKYETAGSLRDGKTIWLLAKLPSETILGDEIAPYICFTNNHDGFGCVKAFLTPTRVVCNNTLNYALQGAKTRWRSTHTGDIQYKLEEARQVLGLSYQYMKKLNKDSESLATQKMSDSDVNKALDIMFPTTEDMKQRSLNNIQDKKDTIIACMMAPDLANFKGTKYQFLQAVADYTSHHETKRQQERSWEIVMLGAPLLNLASSIVHEV